MNNILIFLKRRRTLFGVLVTCLLVLLINFIDTKHLGFPIWGYCVILGLLTSDYSSFRNRGKAKMQSKS